MKQAGWRAGVVLAVAAVAALTFVYLRSPPAPSQAGGSGPTPDAASDGAGRPQGVRAGGSLPASPDPVVGTVVELVAPPEPIPDNLPPVEPQDPPEFRSTLPPGTLYAELPQARSHFADKLPFGVDDRSYIEFNRDTLRELAPGSSLTLHTPDDGRQHQVHIDEVQVHPNGDRSWIGHVLDDAGSPMPAVFTQGVDSSFGSFTTTTGTYSLEAEGRMGWIANINDLRRHQDFDLPDVLEPDPSHAPPPPPGS